MSGAGDWLEGVELERELQAQAAAARRAASQEAVVWSCSLCHRTLVGVAHTRVVLLGIDARGVDSGADVQVCFCPDCARLADEALQLLRSSADAGEKRSRGGAW